MKALQALSDADTLALQVPTLQHVLLVGDEVPETEFSQVVQLAASRLLRLLKGGPLELHVPGECPGSPIEPREHPAMDALRESNLFQESENLVFQVNEGYGGLAAAGERAAPRAVIVGVVGAEAVHLLLGGNGKAAGAAADQARVGEDE